MLTVNLKGCDSFVKKADFEKYFAKALQAKKVLDEASGAGNDFLGWRHIPSEMLSSDIPASCKAIVADWKKMGVDTVCVIGIGGSYLGSKCALEALQNSFEQKGDAPRVIFAGQNLSEDYLSEMMEFLQKRNAACVVISKSGTTTEPAVAFRIVKQFIEQKYGKKEAARRIVAITDKARGALKSLSTQEGYRTFVIEDNVGGRFSVLTPVGLLPIALAGFDIDKMLNGALKMEEACKAADQTNPALMYAAMRNLLYDEYGKKIEILINFAPKLQYFGEWWKQLYGESEGKDGKGIFPASCNFTTDLHSMGQYIQDGERILMETLISVKTPASKLVIESDAQNLDGLNFLAGKRVNDCNLMAQLGTKLAHIDGGVPQLEIGIDTLDENSLGELFFFFEYACGVSAYILGVNPFNQPGVEAYKKNMFALLDKPGYEEASKAIRKRI